MDGKGAKSIADALERWKSVGARYNTTGLSAIRSKKKNQEFAAIVAAWRETHKPKETE